jgi:hypothetical protein
MKQRSLCTSSRGCSSCQFSECLKLVLAAVSAAAVALKLRQALVTVVVAVGSAADGGRQMQLLYSASDCSTRAPHPWDSAYSAAYSNLITCSTLFLSVSDAITDGICSIFECCLLHATLSR